MRPLVACKLLVNPCVWARGKVISHVHLLSLSSVCLSAWQKCQFTRSRSSISAKYLQTVCNIEKLPCLCCFLLDALYKALKTLYFELASWACLSTTQHALVRWWFVPILMEAHAQLHGMQSMCSTAQLIKLLCYPSAQQYSTMYICLLSQTHTYTLPQTHTMPTHMYTHHNYNTPHAYTRPLLYRMLAHFISSSKKAETHNRCTSRHTHTHQNQQQLGEFTHLTSHITCLDILHMHPGRESYTCIQVENLTHASG